MPIELRAAQNDRDQIVVERSRNVVTMPQTQDNQTGLPSHYRA